MSDEVFTLTDAARRPPVLRRLQLAPQRIATMRPAFLAASPLTPLQLRSSEDAFVDELYAAAPACGRAAAWPRGCRAPASTSTAPPTISTRR